MSSSERLGAVAARLTLLGAVIVGTGVLVALLVLPSAVAVGGVVEGVRDGVLDVPPLPDAESPPQNSYIYAADGTELAEINFEENRVPVTLREVPDVAVHAVLATEDSEFYRHEGVNYEAIVRAALTNIQAGGIEQGGSTITQQYVKQAFLTGEQTYSRKLQEALWAIELEERLTKDEILERYLNRTYFGNGVYGIGTAAERYFSKQVGDLTLSEAAMLAGLVRSPERNNPLKSPDNALERRDVVLEQMATHGYISQQQAEAAQQQPLGLHEQPPDAVEEQFWVDWVTELLTEEDVASQLGTQVGALRAMGATEKERIRTVFQSGLRIHTTLRPDLQDLARQSITEHLTYEGETPEEIAQEPMGAIVSVEPATGAITTMAIGPRDYGSCQEREEDPAFIGVDQHGRLLCDKTKLNPVVPGMGGSGRQPGSSFKPFVLAAALESGVPPGWQVNASSGQVIDRDTCPNGGKPWRVNNAGGGGLTDMYAGTKGSVNVFFAKLIAEVGPERVEEVAERIGIFASDLQPVCSLALGAGEVYPLEMASAYATFANRGEWCRPYAISLIEDADGDPIYQQSPDCEEVLDRDVADRVVDIMQGPVQPGGTAPIANLGQWPTRGKTGTTQDYRDAWFVGYVKQLATAAWVGYPNGVNEFQSVEQAREVCPDQHDGDETDWNDVPRCTETRLMDDVTIAGTFYSRVFGGTIPAPMWKQYMAGAVQDLEPESFAPPGPLPTATVPNLVASGSVEAARQLAEDAKLRLVVQTVTDYRPAGTIVGQRPGPGTGIPAGRAVALLVSNGEGEIPTVPNVIGLDADEAQRVLAESGYDTLVVTRTVSRESDIGVVLAQSPEAGTELSPGSGTSVVIQVGASRDSETETDQTDDSQDGGTTNDPSPSPSPDDGPGRGNGPGNEDG